MEKYVLIYIAQSDFTFSIKEELNEKERESLNKNSPYLNVLFYDYKYFKRNILRISKILSEYATKNKTNKVIVNDTLLIDLSINLFNTLNFPYLYLLPERSLTTHQCEKILTNIRVTYVNCYYLPFKYTKKFSERNIQIDTKYDKRVSDKFLLSIDCIEHDTLYYKKNIVIKEIADDVLIDLEEFLKINQNLKGIHLYSYSEEYLKKIIEILESLNKNHIIILLHQDQNNQSYIKENFKQLREINKKYSKETHGEIKIIYSRGFIKNNLFKQLSYNNVKIILFIVAYISLVAIFFSEFYDYVAKYNINKLNEEIINTPIIVEEEIEEDTTPSKYAFEEIFSKLLTINDETVGWLTVNNTNINYPVVKHQDNNYYLNRDFYKSKTKNGWVFMDYRNNIDNLDTNTIVYGHRLKDGSMFGSLGNVIKRDWYLNDDNLTIKFNTLNESMSWKVFSIYRVNYTIDYLKIKFTDEIEFNEFINLISERSVYNFKVPLNYSDKILTLSTCIGVDNERLVVHAKLIK